jgi:hypothetical protein
VINAPQLLADLTKQLKRLESDLLQRIEEVQELKTSLQAEWQAARDANRCAETFETWVDQVITQAGVHWLLSCVFLRFIEDNELVARPWLGGTPASGRLALARDRHEAYFRDHPLENDRDYLLAAFREAEALPGLHSFFDEAHNPVFRLGISGEAAMALRQFWQQVDPNTGALLHDFTDPAWNTRFLGDLYQDLSEATRKRYALLQTPEFVEEFILDRTLTPAIREFGFREVRMIDPTCGSGHFLLGGFARVVDEWQRNEPARNARDIAQRGLDSVSGVDLNPFAVAISRFRLLVAALQVGNVSRLADAPDFQINVAAGDSLLHGRRFGMAGQTALRSESLFDDQRLHAEEGLEHAYASEDLAQVQQILGNQYHAVVGNPPYIVVKDAALNAAYRKRYASCHRQYSLGCPFTERFFELALTGERYGRAGFVGLITANSFMKREFGSKLIEDVLPRLDLTHVIDTSGAYIPGHGTPTVILLGCHRPPHDTLQSKHNTVRAVMGIKGEPSKPNDPAQGVVWRAIIEQVDRPGSESEFVSVADTPRSTLNKHPWSIGGGGAADLREQLETGAAKRLDQVVSDLGFGVVTREDDAYVLGNPALRRHRVDAAFVLPATEGEQVRDWTTEMTGILWPYDVETLDATESVAVTRLLWPYRLRLSDRVAYGKSQIERGLKWFEYSMFFKNRYREPFSIAYGEIATHNHFVFDRGGKVFNRTAPVIKLPAGSSEDTHLGLLGLLNSSVACFWLKQVCHNKGSTVDQHGARQRTAPFEDFYAFNSTKLANFPLPKERPVDLTRALDIEAQSLSSFLPLACVKFSEDGSRSLPTRQSLDDVKNQGHRTLHRMIFLQEELDWRCYALYGLASESEQTIYFMNSNLPELRLGERAFEIVLARRMAAGDETTTWFERHGSMPITELPDHWPPDYRAVVERRIALIESNRNIRLIERPEFKRRWNTPDWEDLEQAALREWLLARLESASLWPANDNQPPQLSSTSRLADIMSRDPEFMQVAALYAGHADFDLPTLVAELVAGEAVPALPVQRYTDTGLRKRAQWQDTWALQHREDAIDAEIDIIEAEQRQALMQIAREQAGGAEPDADALARVQEELDKDFAPLRKARKAQEVGAIPLPPKYQSKDFQKTDFWRLRGGLDVPKERWISFPGCERGADGSLVIAWAGWNHLQQATAIASYYFDMKESEGWEPARLQPLLASLLELLPWLKQWHNEPDPVHGDRMGDYYRAFVSDEARSLGLTLDDLRAWKPAVVAAKRGRRKAS